MVDAEQPWMDLPQGMGGQHQHIIHLPQNPPPGSLQPEGLMMSSQLPISPLGGPLGGPLGPLKDMAHPQAQAPGHLEHRPRDGQSQHRLRDGQVHHQ